jgi:uncharacterized protein
LKFFLFLLTILLGVWLWRKNRLGQLKDKQKEQDRNSQQPQASSSADAASQTPHQMQSCHHCAVHMPEQDMVRGQLGFYCSSEHCRAASDSKV